MFDLIVILSRYLFLFYIVFFLWQGFLYVLDEQGTHIGNPYHALSWQRICIVLMHVTAFLILSYRPGTFLFDKKALLIGAAGLVFLLYVNVTTARVYRKSCPLIWNGMLFLLDLSLIMLQRLNPVLAVKQLIWMIFGFTLTLCIPFILKLIPRFELFEKLYILCSYLLILSTLIFGKEEYGSLNWIKIGPVGFQPSEIVKFLFIFYLASVFRKKVELHQLLETAILSGGIVLLLVVQKDLGGALIFFITYMMMLYIATSNEILFFGGMGCASIAAVLAYYLFSHVRVRVSAWKNPWRDIDSGGYQIVQSLFAISTWGLLGSGLGRGMPLKIPVVSKDFIFAAICEEFGVIFGIGVILIFVMLLLRGIIISLNCNRRYYSLLAAGIITMFAFQTFLIIGGVIKLIPLTGVTLPFISYGGTSIFVSIIMIGLLQWIHVYYEKQHRAGGDRLA